MSGRFNENTRVQVPAAIHLCRLGYTYLDRIDDEDYEHSTNILVKVFREAMSRLNPELSDSEISLHLSNLVQAAKNDDLGREFYQKITATSGVRFIDFHNPNNNLWHCTTEFSCENPDTHDNFRPDITCFVNGLPLAFIEVKKPNNHEGMLAERERINVRVKHAQGCAPNAQGRAIYATRRAVNRVMSAALAPLMRRVASVTRPSASSTHSRQLRRPVKSAAFYVWFLRGKS